MRACNAYSHLNLPEVPTLFLEFHGTPAAVTEQARAAQAGTRQSWQAYWNKSGVRLADPLLEETWYWNLYFLNCSAKAGVTCPGDSATIRGVMAIPNVKRFRPYCPTCNDSFTLMAVLPKDTDVDKYLADAVARHDHKAFQEAKVLHFKVRVGQQKQKKAK